MSDAEDRAMAGTSNDEEAVSIDADFGALEMFDSNAADAPFSSSAVDEPNEKNKKTKKKKKKKDGDRKKKAGIKEPYEEGEHKRAKRRGADLEDDQPEGQAETEAEGTDDEGEGAAKRKRRASDGGARRNKKRKGRDDQDGFLHKDGTEAAVEEDEDDSGPQGSPSVAHAHVDMQDAATAVEQQLAQEESAGAGADADAEATTMASGRPKRSTRKKAAKPSFFEQPQPEYPDEGLEGDLPSPSAISPKPRKRTKAATKKTTKARRRTVHDRDGDDDRDLKPEGDETYDDINDADAPKGRRNRMDGYIKGRFTEEELFGISKQVEAFAEENELSQHDVNEMIQAPGGTSAGEAHAQLWSRLFAVCPRRHRQKVINITRKKFHNFVARGTWTAEQDKELAGLIDVHGTAWSKIAGLINRHPEDLRDRYRNYIVCGANQRKDTWDEEEERRLTQYVIGAMAAIDDLRAMQPSRKLLQKSYEELIDWQNVSEQMDRTRSRLQCITKWKSMNLKTHGKDKLASSQPDSQMSFNLEKARRQIVDMPVAERYRLVLAIRAAEPATEAKIPWHRLNDKEYRNKWHRATQMVLWHRLKTTVPNHEKLSVRECARYLTDQYDRTDQLPDVDDGNFNVADEMRCIQTLSTPTSSARKPSSPSGTANARASRAGKGNGKTLSSDYVNPSDDDEATAAAPQEDEIDKAAAAAAAASAAPTPAPAADDEEEMQIDPALMGEPAPPAGADEDTTDTAAAAAAVAAAAAAAAAAATAAPIFVKKPTSATPVRKPPAATYGKKRGSAAKKRSSATMLSQDPIEDDDDDDAPTAQGENGAAGADNQPLPPTSTRKRNRFPDPPAFGGSTKTEPTDDVPADSSDMEDMDDLPAQVA
ncbi:Myb-like DNA-binding domain [Geosmithia morbida]|uniref:Myb-like DNA-binding domain n=1 Tax=Geosmithia morbida TaxID=1094350 RepID=A0A9P5D4J1_9HYPO|nr:Myb-like DNA-binding domain [Geosmithia morbida]KAF4126107.1 Myb-like DNA-binding domain [Geosmithia morbida]